MRTWIRTLLAACLVLPLSATANDDLSLTAIVHKHGLSWEEALGAVLLADALGLDATLIVGTRKSLGATVFELAPAFAMHKHSGRGIRGIWNQHRRGHGWGVIAQEMGMHPGAFNKSRVRQRKANDAEFEAVIWIGLLSRRYGLTPERISGLRGKGLQWGDIAASLHIAAAAKKEPEAVLARWRKHRNWDRARSDFGVPEEWASQKSRRGGRKKGKGHKGDGGKVPDALSAGLL
ncbi:MAG: hypothetical protein IH851_06005 [Armatimonadetes bacterium]|nr:hypothetical protein [Armatimonadota bacterium]